MYQLVHDFVIQRVAIGTGAAIAFRVVLTVGGRDVVKAVGEGDQGHVFQRLGFVIFLHFLQRRIVGIEQRRTIARHQIIDEAGEFVIRRAIQEADVLDVQVVVKTNHAKVDALLVSRVVGGRLNGLTVAGTAHDGEQHCDAERYYNSFCHND